MNNAALFASGKAETKPEFAELGGRIAAVLNAEPGPVIVNGFTDNVPMSGRGRFKNNHDLSQARAEAVLVALQGRRIDVSGMRAVGYGEVDPIADNTTEAGREANRRIEFILNLPGDTAAPAEGAAPAIGGDDWPSLAPTERTIRPKPRPSRG